MVDSAVLARSPLFADINAEGIKAIIDASEQRHIIEGEDIFLEGDTDTGIWVLVDGRAEVFRRIRGDVDRVLHVLSAGDALGEVSFIDGSIRSAGARTLVSSDFLLLSRDAFARVSKAQPEAAAAFYRNLAVTVATRLRQTNDLYRDSVEFALAAVGAAALNLKSISEELRAVTLHLGGGATVSGRLLQIDHHAAGYALIVKGQDEKTKLVPYHAIQWIELG